MKKFIKYLLCLASLLVSQMAIAQQPAMADGLRSEGKIYVVVIIILIVLAGLITYLFLLDRKITRAEKLLRGKGQTK
jgi:hypothetical protein